jgi:hypothetical protein
VAKEELARAEIARLFVNECDLCAPLVVLEELSGLGD